MRESHRPQRDIFLAILTGLLLFLASPGFFGLAGLAWIALVPLLHVCLQNPPLKSFRLGLISGLVFYLPLLYWIVIVLTTYGQLPLYLSVPAMALLALYMSLYPALFAAGLSWLSRRFPPLWLAPLLWVALDFLRSSLFTGFPWQDLAYSQFQLLLPIQAADLAGHAGVTFLIVLANALLAAVVARFRHGSPDRPRRAGAGAMAAAALLLAASLVYGAVRLRQVDEAISQAPDLPVTVAQGNIAQDQKWTPAFREKTIDTYITLTEEALARQRSELVVWPETAVPFFLPGDPLFSRMLSGLVRPEGINLLTGAPRRELSAADAEMRYFNSALFIAADGRLAAVYDKQHLVPFGEFIPLRRYLPINGPLVEAISDFTPGAAPGPLSCGERQIGVLICFESIFPELARRQAARGAELLVNLTNDAWFGNSSAPWQHLSMAVFRAVENRRSLIRAANTGISGLIDPAGRPVAQTALFEAATLNGRVPLLSTTPFYVRYGHVFAPGCLVLLVPIGFAAWRGRKSVSPC